MSAPTRKHHIKESYSSLGHSENKDSTSWRDVFRDGIEEFSEIGLMLRGGRHKAGLTQKSLAEKLGIKSHHISEMEHGKRTIGKKMAQKLAKIFDVDYRVFL